MPININQLTDQIILREGGYVNDPDDPGGATKFGVTIGTMQRLGLDIDSNGSIDAKDVKALPRETAVNIFKQNYYYRPKIHQLPDLLQASVMDMYVNSGRQAVRLLQKLLCECGQPVTVDGSIGPLTKAACHRVFEMKSPEMLVSAYGIARRQFYYELADNRPQSRKYAKSLSGGKGGWIKRAEEFIAPEFHLSLEAHQRRTSKWVS